MLLFDRVLVQMMMPHEFIEVRHDHQTMPDQVEYHVDHDADSDAF